MLLIQTCDRTANHKNAIVRSQMAMSHPPMKRVIVSHVLTENCIEIS